MPRRDPFKQRRFPKDVILLAVRWYFRDPLSYRYVTWHLPAVPALMVTAATA